MTFEPGEVPWASLHPRCRDPGPSRPDPHVPRHCPQPVNALHDRGMRREELQERATASERVDDEQACRRRLGSLRGDQIDMAKEVSPWFGPRRQARLCITKRDVARGAGSSGCLPWKSCRGGGGIARPQRGARTEAPRSEPETRLWVRSSSRGCALSHARETFLHALELGPENPPLEVEVERASPVPAREPGAGLGDAGSFGARPTVHGAFFSDSSRRCSFFARVSGWIRAGSLHGSTIVW